MGSLDLIILTFREPVRGRTLRAGYLPSDLLWGALYAADVQLQGSPLSVENPYRVSSAFPHVGGEWLLPKPRVTVQRDQNAPAEAGAKKKAKKLEFVRLSDFQRLAAGQPVADLDEALAWQRRALLPVSTQSPDLEITAKAMNRLLKDKVSFPETQYAAPAAQLTNSERLHLARAARGRNAANNTERQRNTQDRITQATDTFTTASLTQPRVAFLLETTSEEQRTRLLAALRLLADRGLGGMRTQGSGQFTHELQPVPAVLRDLLHTSGPQILLGLTHPTTQEAQQLDQAEQTQYALTRRDGYLDGTNLQRQDVWMLTEGSLLPAPVSGQLVDVAPPGYPHPVWRSGLALSVGVNA